jgi:sugar phosphate isomerase/epimerase
MGGAMAAAGLGGAAGAAATQAAAAAPGDIKLGVASYSLREFQRDLAIRMIRQLGVPYVSVKECHLSYRSTPQELEAGAREFEKAGLIIAGGGTIYMMKDDDDDIRRYFDYARACHMPLMTIGPTHENLRRIEKFVKEYDIKVAIHNHGPEDERFPSPVVALKAVQGMDPRMGLCIDVGHAVRTGANIVESVRSAGPRLLDMHIKDLRDLKDRDSQVPVGDGAIPIVGIFQELKRMNYAGCVNLEYEVDADSPLLGMSKSLSYMRGVLAGLKG